MIFAIVSVPERAQQLGELLHFLGLQTQTFIDFEAHGANWNHRRALAWAGMQRERVVILEDDAQPVEGFYGKVGNWLIAFPDDVISFYLGKGRPFKYQDEIADKLNQADTDGLDYITLDRLIHGVCYSIPQKDIPKVLANWDHQKPADYCIGDALGRRIIYPCSSLVEHEDGQSYEQHPDGQQRTEVRKAWRLG